VFAKTCFFNILRLSDLTKIASLLSSTTIFYMFASMTHPWLWIFSRYVFQILCTHWKIISFMLGVSIERERNHSLARPSISCYFAACWLKSIEINCNYIKFFTTTLKLYTSIHDKRLVKFASIGPLYGRLYNSRAATNPCTIANAAKMTTIKVALLRNRLGSRGISDEKKGEEFSR